MRAWQIFTKRGKPVVDTTGRLVIYARKRDAKFHCSESHPGRRFEAVDIHVPRLSRYDIEEEPVVTKTPDLRPPPNIFTPERLQQDSRFQNEMDEIFCDNCGRLRPCQACG
jgi:hypothetical protein